MTDPRALVCPRCRASWPEAEAPGVCTNDGSSLVRAKELVAGHHDPMVGRTLEGRYTITARLGSGSMGTVYRAKQHAMGREVAIKILRGDRAIDDTAKARFMREARANSLLASPNTVTVFDFGQSESGEFYLAMELLEGESLGQRLTRVPRLPIPMAVDAARQALRSLAEAHAKGIIHRDLKPDNIFFARVLKSATASSPVDGHEEIVKILDFGIAKMVRDGDEAMGVVETQAGTVFGTPRYMSPEQAQGKPLDARTDLYSLGVILYQMLTGRPPFTDNDAVVVMARHIKSIPKRMSEVAPEAKVPRELEDVVMRLLAKNPEERQPSAEVLASELATALDAQVATTSGVRASIADANRIALPDSRHPPPMASAMAMATPMIRRPEPRGIPTPLLVALVPLVILVAAAGVWVGMKSNHPPPTSGASEPSAAQTAPEPPASTVSIAPAPPPTEPTPPVIDPRPAAPPTSAAQASPAIPQKGHPTRPGGRPPKSPPPTPASAPPPKTASTPQPAPQPSTTSSYGVFDP